MADLVINVAVYGVVPESEILTRDAAAAGDVVFSTGFLGDSRAGLHLILDKASADTPGAQGLAHRPPATLAPPAGGTLSGRPAGGAGRHRCERRPELRPGAHRRREPGGRTAGCGENPGLSKPHTLLRPLQPLGAGVRPVRRRGLHPAGDRSGRRRRRHRRATSSSASADRFTRIGEITASPGIELVHADGNATAVAPTGWDHFKGH